MLINTGNHFQVFFLKNNKIQYKQKKQCYSSNLLS